MEGKRFVAPIMPHVFNRTAGERDVGVCGPGNCRQVSFRLASKTVRYGFKVNGKFAGTGQADTCGRDLDKDDPGLSWDVPEFELRVDLSKLLLPPFVSIDPRFYGIGARDQVQKSCAVSSHNLDSLLVSGVRGHLQETPRKSKSEMCHGGIRSWPMNVRVDLGVLAWRLDDAKERGER